VNVDTPPQTNMPGMATRALVNRCALITWLVVVTGLGLGSFIGLAGGAFARPFDTIDDRRDARLMLGGHDPVSYYRQARPTLGRPEIRVELDGVVYRFASEASRGEFQRDPARWVPAFGGYCAYGMVHALPIHARAEIFEILDGRLYLFGSERSRAWFLMERELNLQLASRWWRDEVGGSIVVLQRAFRTIVPVPNRRDPEDLERDYRDRLHTGRL